VYESEGLTAIAGKKQGISGARGLQMVRISGCFCYQWVVSDEPGREDLRSLCLRTKHWTETQVISISTVLLIEKKV
jgi:hypothetical protein